jgi:hypothetical protein
MPRGPGGGAQTRRQLALLVGVMVALLLAQ